MDPDATVPFAVLNTGTETRHTRRHARKYTDISDSNATMEFGMFDATDGYFLRVVGDELYYVRRTSSGERPQDHLDGYTAQGTDPTTFTVDTAVMTAQPTRTDEGTIYKLTPGN